jgi:hypothetical protein
MFLSLNQLSKKEFRKFEKFVNTPYFNVNQKIIQLFKYLNSYYPDITEDDVEPSMVWNAATNETVFNSENHRKLVSDFTELFERFLVQNEFEEDKEYSKIILLRNLRKRKIKKRFDKNYSELMKEMDSTFSKDGDYYIKRALAIGEKYQLEFSKIKYEFSPLLQEQSDNMDYLILFEKLHLFHQMFQSSRKPGTKDKYRKEWYNEALEKVESNVDLYKQQHPNIYIIYLVLKMFSDDDEHVMNQLANYLSKTSSKFPKVKLSYYYEYLTSYCITKYNEGETDYRKKALEFYKLMDRMDIMVIEDVILDSLFNNVVNVALGEKDFHYAEKFIEKYKSKIDDEFAKDSYSLAKAKLLFYSGEFDKMFDFVSKVEYRDPNYYINSKILTARAFIDNNESLSASYINSNLKQYLRTNKDLTKDQKNSITLFLKYFRYLLKLQGLNGKNAAKLKKVALTELLADKQPIPARNWFREKLS